MNVITSPRRGILLFQTTLIARSLAPLVMTALLSTSALAQTFTRADTAALRRTLDGIATAHRGVMGYSVSNIDTGERLSLRGDETFSTASLIKVPILVTLHDLVDPCGARAAHRRRRRGPP